MSFRSSFEVFVPQVHLLHPGALTKILHTNISPMARVVTSTTKTKLRELSTRLRAHFPYKGVGGFAQIHHPSYLSLGELAKPRRDRSGVGRARPRKEILKFPGF